MIKWTSQGYPATTWAINPGHEGETTRDNAYRKIEAVPYQRYRLNISENGGANRWCLEELSFYDDSGTRLVTSPSGGSAQTEYSSAHAAGMAFDEQSDNDPSYYCSSSDVKTGWLQYTFDTDVQVASYHIERLHGRPDQFSPVEPVAWTLTASSDGGISWNILDTQSGQTTWSDGEVKSFTIGQASIAYNKFHCATRADCVKELNLDISHFIEFQCKCIDDHYQEYLDTGEWPSETTQMCRDFIECLQGKHSIAERLVVNMARVLGKANAFGLMEEKASGVNEQVATTTTCFEPSNATYAALVECECLEDLIAICGGSLVEDTVGCLFEHACNHSKVCGDWKASHCPYSALQMQYSSDAQERTLLQQLFPKADKDERLWQGQGLKLPQFERTMSHLGLTGITPGQVKSLWDSLETDLLGNRSHELLDFKETRRSPLSTRNLKHNGDLNDDLRSQSLDATVLGKCTAD
jgi:hypothetical protein